MMIYSTPLDLLDCSNKHVRYCVLYTVHCVVFYHNHSHSAALSVCIFKVCSHTSKIMMMIFEGMMMTMLIENNDCIAMHCSGLRVHFYDTLPHQQNDDDDDDIGKNDDDDVDNNCIALQWSPCAFLRCTVHCRDVQCALYHSASQSH